uniref:Protein LBH n=1 Tax=Vombatus ursinus TaxID=29139 RepID=A0A4X2K1B7_VOMUR
MLDHFSISCLYFPIYCPDNLRSADMIEVMMSTPCMDEIGLNTWKDGISCQIFPDPSGFDHNCKRKDCLPSIMVEPTKGEVESGEQELRWLPEEFLVQENEQETREEGKQTTLGAL